MHRQAPRSDHLGVVSRSAILVLFGGVHVVQVHVVVLGRLLGQEEHKVLRMREDGFQGSRGPRSVREDLVEADEKPQQVDEAVLA